MQGSGRVARQGNAYRRAWRGLRGPLVLAGVFSAVINVLMLTGSVYMLQVYDRVLSSGSLPTLFGLFAVVVVLYLFLGFYDFLRARILSRAALRLDIGLGPEAFRVWLTGAGPGGRGPEGEPLQDLGLMRGFLSGAAVQGLFDVPWIPLYFLLLFLVHPWLGILTLAGAAVVALAAWVGRVLTQRSLAAGMAADAAERSFTEQARQNAEVIAALGMQTRVIALWDRMHLGNLAAGQPASDVGEAIGAFSRSFRMFLQSATLTAAALLVLRQEISAGMIVASSIIAGRALAPIDQVIGHWRTIGRAWVAHRRLDAFFEGLSAPPEAIELALPTGAIQVSRLVKLGPAGQAGGDRPRLLNQVSFALAAGDGLGVIGNSASGKSTLARLIVGAWAPDGGEIRLDGATPDQWHPDRLGRAIGYLPQTVAMLPGTIRDNIARFDAAAPDTAVIEAARLAGVHEMILALPAGYATRLGAGGPGGGAQQLSGGQIQRLGLARALFGGPRIVVLDEPNSNLDAGGDTALTQAIATIRSRGATVIVMAHRPSAIAAVNKLLILHNGAVAAFGPKDEVLGAAGPAPAPAADPAPAGQTAVFRHGPAPSDRPGG